MYEFYIPSISRSNTAIIFHISVYFLVYLSIYVYKYVCTSIDTIFQNNFVTPIKK